MMSTSLISVQVQEQGEGETNNSPNPNSKQQQQQEEEDRISGLPDAIIHHILSFLPTKDAITTGSLSSRWKHQWTSVPNLSFTYEDSPRHLDHFLQSIDKTQFKLSNVSSLVDVTLDFSHFDIGTTHPECCHWVWQLLENVKHAHKLTLGAWCIQVLSVAMEKEICPPLSKNSFTCLTLTTVFEEWDFLGVASLLRSSPFLEKLVLDRVVERSFSLEEFYYVDCHISKDYWRSQAGSFDCLQRVLKTIQVVGLGRLGCWQSHCRGYILEFIKFLLRSAKVLEKLVILAPRHTERTRRMNHYYTMSQRILSYPKSSDQVAVLLT